MAEPETEHTGGMIALVPADPEQLTVDGGDPAQDLHLTLAYLGDDVTSLGEDERVAILDTVRTLAAATPPIEGEVMGHAAFNPTGAHDREPCAVYLVTADALPALKEQVASIDKGDHPVFLPHITAGYGVTPDRLSFVGPVTFDRLRVALADDVHDFPLGETQEAPVPDTLAADGATAVAPDDVEVTGPAVNGEIPIRLPVVVIEGLDTSDGRYLAAGSLSPRALPLPLLAQPESAHGGDDAGAAGVVGRIDTLERIPGPDVISKRTGQPFPEGTFVWVGTGAISENASVGGYDVADLFRRRFLRGISVDLAGMDYEVLGDDGSPLDPEHPRRQIVTHAAEIAAMTLVPIPAFGDCYAEEATETEVLEPVAIEAIAAAGLTASAVPSYRSAELGDFEEPETDPAALPADAVEQIAAVIDDGSGVQRDAAELAQAIVDYIAAGWAGPAPAEPEVPGLAAAADPVEDAGEGDPESPQSCEMGPEPAVKSLLFRDDTAFAATCAEHEQDVRDQLAASGETVSSEVAIEGATAGEAPEMDPGPMADQPADQPVAEEPLDEDLGLPNAPQDCLFGDAGPHPATQSLLFDGGQQMVGCCDEHVDLAAAEIADGGYEVEQTVPIETVPVPA